MIFCSLWHEDNDSVLFSLWLEASTLSAEKFFCGESGAFLGAFWVLFLVLICGLVAVCWCFSVTFYVVMRDV